MENHFLCIGDVVVFSFPTEVSWRFAWEMRRRIERLGLFVSHFVKKPVIVTRTFSKFNQIFLIGDKEILQFVKDRWSVNLKGMWYRVEYLFCSMDWVSDDNNFWYSWRYGSLIYTTSDGKQFGFCIIDIYYMVKGFDDRFVVNVYISNRCSHIILDTSISNNKYIRRVFQWRKS